MFYAIERATGRGFRSNGAKTDRVMVFTAIKLRAAWIGDGAQADGPGSRAVLVSLNTAYRRDWLEDGDREAWRTIAAKRVADTPKLNVYREVIFQDWGDSAHAEWVATASQREIIGWAKAVSDD